MSEVKLLDCTLGTGGELNSWSYGEDVIHAMRPMILKSGIDIVEYGVLCGHTLGPNCTVYNSTWLPTEFEKQAEQIYAILLDKSSRPSLSQIPKRGKYTADMIRVMITRERAETELEYCTALQQKGYQVYLMIEEISQYEKEELTILLRKACKIIPWGCCIYDVSGILNESTLQDLISVYEEVLPVEVWIGFHGRDNLQCVSDLAKMFCRSETKHGLCVEISVDGMGAGAHHLASAEFAGWMNDFFVRAYDVPMLKTLKIYTGQYMRPKNDDVVKFLYRMVAQQKCSYRYVEYYCQLSIEPAVQVEIYKEILHKATYKFNKSEANRALMNYWKRRMNLVIVIPTANRPMAVDLLLYHSVRDLLRYGVDIVIYDSSDDNKTYAVTRNFQIDGYDNVYYKRYTGEFDGLSIDRKVLTAFEEHLNYDYIWLCGDGLIPTISRFYHELMTMVEKGTEFIAVDWINRNDGRYRLKNYDSCVEFFEENAGRMNTLGCSIFKSTFVKRLLREQPLNESNYGFWIPIAPLHQMAVEPVITGQIIANVFQYNPGGSSSSYWVKGMLRTWGENWYRTVMGLPAIYDPVKKAVLKVHTSDFRPFNLKSMLTLRAADGFNLSVYRQYRFILSQISDNVPWKFYFAALTPKSLAKLLLRVEKHWVTHPDSWSSKLTGKLYKLYVRLGE